jgi:hypothetical protein
MQGQDPHGEEHPCGTTGPLWGHVGSSERGLRASRTFPFPTSEAAGAQQAFARLFGSLGLVGEVDFTEASDEDEDEGEQVDSDDCTSLFPRCVSAPITRGARVGNRDVSPAAHEAGRFGMDSRVCGTGPALLPQTLIWPNLRHPFARLCDYPDFAYPKDPQETAGRSNAARPASGHREAGGSCGTRLRSPELCCMCGSLLADAEVASPPSVLGKRSYLCT